MLVQNSCKRECSYTTTRLGSQVPRELRENGLLARQSPTGWILGRPVYPAVHRLGGWRSWNQPRGAPRLGVKKRPPRVRSHGLQGRIARGGVGQGRQVYPLHGRTDFFFQEGRDVTSSQSAGTRGAWANWSYFAHYRNCSWRFSRQTRTGPRVWWREVLAWIWKHAISYIYSRQVARVLQVVLLRCRALGWRVSPLGGSLGRDTGSCAHWLWWLQVQNAFKPAEGIITLSLLVFHIYPGERGTEI